jgi:hypothetical protein
MIDMTKVVPGAKIRTAFCARARASFNLPMVEGRWYTVAKALRNTEIYLRECPLVYCDSTFTTTRPSDLMWKQNNNSTIYWFSDRFDAVGLPCEQERLLED